MIAKKKIFVKPTEEEVRAYCTENGFDDVDAGQFVDYYESNGWKVGKSPMKDWKRTVNRWHRNRFDQSRGPSPKRGPVGMVLESGKEADDENAYRL